MTQETPKIPPYKVLPVRSLIVADTVVGDEGEEQSVTVHVPWKNLDSEQKQQFRRAVKEELERNQKRQAEQRQQGEG